MQNDRFKCPFPKQKIYCYSSEQLVETCKTLYHYQKNKSHSAFEMGASHLEKMLYNILHSSTIEKAAIWEEFPIKKLVIFMLLIIKVMIN